MCENTTFIKIKNRNMEKKDTEETDIVAELEKELENNCKESYEIWKEEPEFENCENWYDVRRIVMKREGNVEYDAGVSQGYEEAMDKVRDIIKSKENKI